MQKWEYMTRDATFKHNKGGKPIVVWGDWPEENDENPIERLQKFGLEGWELASISAIVASDGIVQIYYFKRPIEE